MESNFGKLPILILCRKNNLIAVSYTHLDVYKRQTLVCSMIVEAQGIVTSNIIVPVNVGLKS